MINTVKYQQEEITASKHLPEICSGKGLTFNFLDEWFTERENTKSEINEISSFMKLKKKAVPYFSADDIGQIPSSLIMGYASNAYENVVSAIANLDASLWERLMKRTKLQDSMTSKKKKEWSNLIEDRAMPEFTRENVMPTMRNLILEQGLYFAERVETVFNALSPNHVTNSPAAFGKRIIIEKLLKREKGYDGGDLFSLCHGNDDKDGKGAIDDLRVIVSILLGRSDFSLSKAGTSDLLDDMLSKRMFGQWVDIDGNSLRIKLFKVGTAHIEIHPDIAYKLNDILAMLYPHAIPESFRRPSNKKPSLPDFELPIENNTLPLPTLFVVHSMRRIPILAMGEDTQYLREKLPNKKHVYKVTFPSDGSCDLESVISTLKFIGGNQVDEHGTFWDFDYNPINAINVIYRTGVLPKIADFQFYPTKGNLSELAASTLRAHIDVEQPDLLEPNIGQGDLAEAYPDAKWTGVELSEVNAMISKSKGFNVIHSDFIAWSKKNTTRYDGVLMNPPFKSNQASSHVLAAFETLKDSGVLVSIMPCGTQIEKVKAALPNCDVLESEDYEYQFEGTNVKVKIITILSKKKTARPLVSLFSA